MTPSASRSGSFLLGGDLPVHRLGFGAMRITGEGVWGAPKDPVEARRVLRRLLDLDVNFIDTADSYGPLISELLIAEVLHPYKPGLVVATKGGLTRAGPQQWAPVGRPEYLRQCVQLSLRHLRVERLDLWQLHRIDPKVPRDEQFDAIAELQRAGLIRHVGLSEVKVADLEAAQKYFPVVSVQNLYNLVNRQSEDVVNWCTQHQVAFIPWFPLAAGSLAKPGGALDAMAKRLDASPAQLALAWVLKRSPVMLPIPGTASVAHLEENVRAAHLSLTQADFDALDALGREEWAKTKT